MTTKQRLTTISAVILGVLEDKTAPSEITNLCVELNRAIENWLKSEHKNDLTVTHEKISEVMQESGFQKDRLI
jgi:hypothetical protein